MWAFYFARGDLDYKDTNCRQVSHCLQKCSCSQFGSGEKKETWEAVGIWGRKGASCAVWLTWALHVCCLCAALTREEDKVTWTDHLQWSQGQQSSLIAPKVRIESWDGSASCKSCGQAALGAGWMQRKAQEPQDQCHNSCCFLCGVGFGLAVRNNQS